MSQSGKNGGVAIGNGAKFRPQNSLKRNSEGETNIFKVGPNQGGVIYHRQPLAYGNKNLNDPGHITKIATMSIYVRSVALAN